MTGEAISLSASTESLRQCRVLENRGRRVASEVTPAKSQVWVWAARQDFRIWSLRFGKRNLSIVDDLTRTQRLRKSPLDTMADADYVSVPRYLSATTRKNADSPPRTPSRLPVRLPFELDETLWIGHKGAWKIGYRLTWCLCNSPQGQEIFPQVLLPWHRP